MTLKLSNGELFEMPDNWNGERQMPWKAVSLLLYHRTQDYCSPSMCELLHRRAIAKLRGALGDGLLQVWADTGINQRNEESQRAAHFLGDLLEVSDYQALEETA